MLDTLLQRARDLQPRTVALRRQIHEYPELGNHVPKTRAAILDALADLDLDIQLSKTTDGLVITLPGNGVGGIIVLRADMDALPMPEETGLSFASKTEGCMHACGHDAHSAMLVTAVRLLHEERARFPGTVKFMFQPGEEGPGGAQPMLDEGLLDAPHAPDAAFALHVMPTLQSGVVTTRAGAFLAAADTMSVCINGRGGHGSMPYDALDPIPVACEIVQAIQVFVTRRFSVADPVVITVGRIEAGTASNVIPAEAHMEITLRSFSAPARQRAIDGVNRIATHVAQAHSMTADTALSDEGYPATINDAGFADFVGATARSTLGPHGFEPMADPLMAAEDFSYVLDRFGGAMALLGVALPGIDAQHCAPCHSTTMQIDEDAMAHGVAMHAATAIAFLNRRD